MSATLNGIQCNAADVWIPRSGVPFATVSISNGGPFAEGARVTLAVAGLSLSCTVVGAGSRGGVQEYELAGGAGGWGTTIPASAIPNGYRNDAGVRLSTVARDLAAAVGESLAAVPVALDRSLGMHFLLGAEQHAGAALSLLCSSPERAPVLPWYVANNGVTNIGARQALPAVTRTEVDRDTLGTWVAFAEEDASVLMPGATYEGRAIGGLEIRVTSRGIQERVYLEEAALGGRVSTFVSELRRWVLDLLRPLFLSRGIYAYRVTRIVGTRYDAVPVRSRWAKPIDGLYLWPGAAGHHARPKVGSTVLVSFVDADPGQPVVVGFQPLDGSLGLPQLATFNGVRVDVGEGATGELIARFNDGGDSGSLTIANGPSSPPAPSPTVLITYAPPSGAPTVWTITGAISVVGVPSTTAAIRTIIDQVGNTKAYV